MHCKLRFSYGSSQPLIKIPLRFCYYEQMADVQMLAMLSCVFSERCNIFEASGPLALVTDHFWYGYPLFRSWDGICNYFQSEAIVRSYLYELSTTLSNSAEPFNITSRSQSANSSTGAHVSDLSTSTTPPSIYRPFRATYERRESLVTSLSTSPEQMKQTHRLSPSLHNLRTHGTRPFMVETSTTSSSPWHNSKKRSSPAGSCVGVSTPTNVWHPTHLFGRSSSLITEGTRSSRTMSISEAEDQGPEATKRTDFTTTLKNQQSFNNDGYSDIPLLDPQMEWRCRAYREAYAHLLYVWNMPVARAEMLKFNHVSNNDTRLPVTKPQSPLTIGRDLQGISFGSTTPRPHFRDHCQNCNIMLTEGSTNRRCQNCSSRCRHLTCILCNTSIHGISSPCLKCGHVLHNSCREIVVSQLVPSECVSGCGCMCTNYGHIKMEVDASKTKQAESSLAVTVVGDAITDEQEQLGWYDNSEWEDMAYESLARNLRPKRQVKPKSSQIWRGRKDST